MSGSSLRWFWLALGLLALALGGALLFSIGGLVKLLLICALLAYVLDPVASYFESCGLSRTAATVTVFLSLGAVLSALTLILYPAFAQELEALQAGEYATKSTALVDQVEKLLHNKFAFLGMGKVNLTEVIQQTEGELGKNLSTLLFANFLSSIAHVVAIPFVIFFLLKDGRELKKRLINLVPNPYFEFTLNLLHRMDLALGNFLRGQFLDGVIFGLLTTLAMWLLKVKYFLFIGIFAGLANLIPYVGPLVGVSLAVLVVMVSSGDWARLPYVILAFAAIKLLDDALIQPLAVAKSVKMHPLVVLLVIIIGGHFFGILGMLLAVPVAGFLQVGAEAGLALVRAYRGSRLVEEPPGHSSR